MNRLDLIDKLSLCAPALAKTAFMPILSCFWFTGTHIMAFNDQIAIATPFKTDFKGGLQGDLLLGLLRNSRAKEVKMEPINNGTQINMVAGSTKAKLAMEPPSGFSMPVPKPDPAKQIKLGKQAGEFVRALDLCLLSISSDLTYPDQQGVTFMSDPIGLGMYSTNYASVSQGKFKLAKKWPERAILPTLFCEQLKAVGSKRYDIALECHKDHVLAVINDVNEKTDPMLIFTRIIESERPFDFTKIIASHYPEKVRKAMTPLPSSLKLVAERAFLVAQDKAEKLQTQVKVADGLLSFYTGGKSVEVRDTAKMPDNPDGEIFIEIKHFRSAISSYYSAIEEENGDIFISDRAIIMSQGSNVYILSEADEPKK